MIGKIVKYAILLLLFPIVVFAGSLNDPADPYTSAGDITNAAITGNCGNIIYADGTFTTTITISAQCTEGNELTISASNGSVETPGEANFNGGIMYMNSDYVILKYWDFDGGQIRIGTEDNADYNIIEHCIFRRPDTSEAVIELGSFGTDSFNNDNEIRYNTFTGSFSGRFGIRIGLSVGMGAWNRGNYNTHIHHNLWYQTTMADNYETIQVGPGATSSWVRAGTIIEFNRWQEVNAGNNKANELVSWKSSGIFRYNLVYHCDSHIKERNTREVTFDSNYFYADPDPAKNFSHGISGGGPNSRYINNYIQMDEWVSEGSTNSAFLLSSEARHTSAEYSSSNVTNTVITISPNPGWTTNEWTSHRLWMWDGDDQIFGCNIDSNTANTVTVDSSYPCPDLVDEMGFDNTITIQFKDNSGAAHDSSEWIANTVHWEKYEVLRVGTGDSLTGDDNMMKNNLFFSDYAATSNGTVKFNNGWNNPSKNNTFFTNIIWHPAGITRPEFEDEDGNARPTHMYIEDECTWVGDNSCDPDFTTSAKITSASDADGGLTMYIPQSTGAAHNAGTSDALLTDDIFGNPRGSNPTIGAYEIGGSIPAPEEVGASWDGLAYTVPGRVGGDVTNPVVQITDPTTATTYDNGSSDSVTVGGTCSDDTAVDRVDWANATSGGGGTATGTETWSTTVALVEGDNSITVTCYDTSNNTHTDSITVTYTAASITEPHAVGNVLGGTFK